MAVDPWLTGKFSPKGKTLVADMTIWKKIEKKRKEKKANVYFSEKGVLSLAEADSNSSTYSRLISYINNHLFKTSKNKSEKAHSPWLNHFTNQKPDTKYPTNHANCNVSNSQEWILPSKNGHSRDNNRFSSSKRLYVKVYNIVSTRKCRKWSLLLTIVMV